MCTGAESSEIVDGAGDPVRCHTQGHYEGGDILIPQKLQIITRALTQDKVVNVPFHMTLEHEQQTPHDYFNLTARTAGVSKS